MAEEPLYVCPCGYGPKPYFSAMGHRGRSKNPLCKTGDLRQVSGSPPAREEADAPREAEADGGPSAPEGTPVAALGMQAGAPAEPSPQLEPTPAPTNGHVEVEERRGGVSVKEGGERREAVPQPTLVSERIALSVYVRSMYDVYRAHYGFRGTFPDFVEACLLDYWELLGLQLNLTVVDQQGREAALDARRLLGAAS